MVRLFRLFDRPLPEVDLPEVASKKQRLVERYLASSAASAASSSSGVRGRVVCVGADLARARAGGAPTGGTASGGGGGDAAPPLDVGALLRDAGLDAARPTVFVIEALPPSTPPPPPRTRM